MAYITNQKLFLSEIINNILPLSESLKILVGYFYFSGFEQIYKAIEDKDVKILVGLDIEVDLMNRVKEYAIINYKNNQSRASVRDKYLNSLKDAINETNLFDSIEKQEAFEVFLKKIQDNTLQIKKTLDPNHAKLYLFKTLPEFNQLKTYPGTVITGSSNLTLSGLKNQKEINHISREPNDFNELDKFFDELWDNAVEIVSPESKDEFFEKVVSKIWLKKLPSPYLIFIRVLKEFFTITEIENIKTPASLTKQKFDLKYQIDAIKQSLSILEKHNGVIIADVVGLGKSIVASTIAANLGKKTVIICPPHLTKQWDDYRFEFGYNAKVYSCGLIEEALKENHSEETKLIIIDEAHRYRNPLTIDYANLHKLCQGNKVILLSATPYNNTPEDLFSLIKLFQIPSKSTLQTVDNLSFEFSSLITSYKELKKKQKENKIEQDELKAKIDLISEEMRSILYPLVIRRSRIDLDLIKEYRTDLKKQGIEFPIVNPPVSLDYKLESLSKLYIKTLDMISPKDETKGFQGVRYKSITYIKEIEKYKKEIEEALGDIDFLRLAQMNLAKFMRRQLVRRFESSIKAFKISLDTMINSSELILNWHDKLSLVPIFKKGTIPSVEDMMDDSECEDDMKDDTECVDSEDTLETIKKKIDQLKQKGYFFIDKKELKVTFREELVKDIELLKKIKTDWALIDEKLDPKLKYFKQIVKEKFNKEPSRKILVFSEFADTVNYLYDNIKSDFRVFKYTSADSSKKNKKIIVENFDASNSTPKNDYDILLATDAISEGFNLGRAGAVFNYDIPYNPTRVIQRVGRINRISHKMFDELFIYNFFPTAIGEKETRTKQISTLKIAMIQAILGEDTKVLTNDEELESFMQKRYSDASKETEQESWDAKYIDMLNSIESENPSLIEKALEIPKRVRIKRSVNKGKNGVLVFGKKGENSKFNFGTNDSKTQNITFKEALSLFEAGQDEMSKEVSQYFEPIYQDILKNLFNKKTQSPSDKGKADTIFKIKTLQENYPPAKDYTEDLLRVVKELDNLPERYEKLIRNLDTEDYENMYQILIREIPHQYLRKIIKRANEIDDERETIILSEEFEQ